jgi:hypothetical protein
LQIKKKKAVPGQDGHGVRAVVSFHSKYQPNQINKLVGSIEKEKERKGRLDFTIYI